MTDPLAKLFGSIARLKLLRLFLFNPLESFTLSEAAIRTQVEPKEARAEIVLLTRTGVLKKNRRGKQVRFEVNQQFAYIRPLQELLLNVTSRGEEITERLRPTGSLKLIVVAGMFVGEWESKIDLLVVGDKVKERALRNQVKKLEADIGREIRYTLLPTPSFMYRLNMSDRLMRDIFDFPHRVVLDKLDIGLK